MNTLVLILAVAGMLLVQTLIGGARLIYAIPGYLLVCAAGVAAIVPIVRRSAHAIRLPLISTLLLVVYVVVRSYASPVEYLARTDRLMVLGGLIIYVLFACVITNPAHRIVSLLALLVFSLFHLGAGIIQFTGGENFMLLSQMPPATRIPEIFRGADYGWRASGFYVCPNHLAGLLECLAMLAIARCFFGRAGALGRLLCAYFAVSALVGVALTGSRGGYISTAVGTATLFALGAWIFSKTRSKVRLRTVLIVIGGMLILLPGGILLMLQSSLISERINQLADTNNMRLLMWAAALRQFSLNPIFGTGSGTYLFYGREFRAEQVQNDPQHVHNDYLELLCEYGIVGCVLFALFLVTHMVAGFRALSAIVANRMRPARRTFSNELAMLVGVISALAALLVHSVFDFNCHVPGNVLFYAMLFGVLACPSVDSKIAGGENGISVRVIAFSSPVAAVVLGFLCLSILRGEYHNEWARVHLRNHIHFKLLANIQTKIAGAFSLHTVGVILPATGMENTWKRDHLFRFIFPASIKHAEAALQTEKKNPDLYYHLGEARHFLALYAPPGMDKTLMFAAAGDAYAEGVKLFPQDSRLQFKLARAYDTVGLLDRAESHYAQAIRGDPSLGNLYAYYGHHVWLRRQLVRAEAYYHRALQLASGNEVASSGLREIQKIRELARNREYVEEYGDPLETFNLDPPTPEDEARGVLLVEPGQ